MFVGLLCLIEFVSEHHLSRLLIDMLQLNISLGSVLMLWQCFAYDPVTFRPTWRAAQSAGNKISSLCSCKQQIHLRWTFVPNMSRCIQITGSSGDFHIRRCLLCSSLYMITATKTFSFFLTKLWFVCFLDPNWVVIMPKPKAQHCERR